MTPATQWIRRRLKPISPAVSGPDISRLFIELADEGCIEIEDMERSWFGSLLTEGYSQIVWKPL